MRSIRRTISRHGIEYGAVLTIIVTFAGAAGMYYFENPAAVREAGFAGVTQAGGGLQSYGEAIWWTAMVLTTLGSEYWPKSVSMRKLGRISRLASMYRLASKLPR
jgi:voltage-gated potassium channel